MRTETISEIETFVGVVRDISTPWYQHTSSLAVWFRGEPAVVESPLIPKIWRPEAPPDPELQLLQDFRLRAIAYTPNPPHREDTDQWLFLAAHAGLPTRLLDWTESALAALYFALAPRKPGEDAVVWALEPRQLNRLSDPMDRAMIPLTWTPGNNPIAHNNVRCAWEGGLFPGELLPVAVYPPHMHPRITAQRSCFTIHGLNQGSIQTLVAALGNRSPLLAKIVIPSTCRDDLLRSLRMLGVSHATMYPDLDHLADELEGS